MYSIYCKVKERIHGETNHAISIKRGKCTSGWMDGFIDVTYSLGKWLSLSNHPCLFFLDMVTPFSLFFLGHASLACHLFSFWGNHNLTLFYFRDVLRERLPRHEAFIDGEWMDSGANSQCRNVTNGWVVYVLMIEKA